MSLKLRQKIRNIRVNKEFSQEYMANQLGISQNTYSKVESNDIKLTNERLMQISEIFDINIENIADYENGLVFNIKKQENKESIVGCYNANYISDNEKELTKSLIAEKNKIIQLLEDHIKSLG